MGRPVFSSRGNECVKLSDGREVWLSRSVAVVSTVVVRLGGQDHVALIERGPALPDEVGKLALPGGYLDWDETLYDGARREVFEETGLDVADWEGARLPWRIHDEPLRKQNITMHFSFRRTAEALPSLGEGLEEHPGEPLEITRRLWLPIEEAMERELAFGHQHVLRAWRAGGG